MKIDFTREKNNKNVIRNQIIHLNIMFISNLYHETAALKCLFTCVASDTVVFCVHALTTPCSFCGAFLKLALQANDIKADGTDSKRDRVII